MQAVIMVFDDTEEFDNIIMAVRHIFSEDDSVMVYATVAEKTEEVLAIFKEEEECPTTQSQ